MQVPLIRAIQTRCWLRAVAALVLLLGVTARCPANEPITLPPSGTVTDLKLSAEYLPVTEMSQFTPEALSAARFLPWTPALDDSAPPLWLRLHLRAPEQARSDWNLKIKRRYFPQLEVLVLDPTLYVTNRYSLGFDDYVPGKIAAEEYVLPLHMAAGEQRTVLIRVETLQQALSALSMTAEDELTLRRARSTSNWAFGLYFGSVIALLIYNFLLYLNLHTPGHRMYVIAISVVLVFMAMDSGLAQGLLPPALRERELMLFVALAALMMVTTTRFFQVFASSAEHMPRGHLLLNGTNVVLLVLTVVTALSPVPWARWLGPVTQGTISIATLLLLAVSILASLRGSGEARIFTLAWSAFLAGSLVRTLVGTGQLPQVPAAQYMVYVGSVAEAMILALGLSLRVGQLRLERNRAQAERARAIEIANLDVLTGLRNRRYLSTHLDELRASLPPEEQRGALLLFDLDHFKQINDTHGHDAGDAALIAVSDRCRHHLRDEDVVCRLGGDEFAVILKEIDGDSALQTALRLHTAITRDPVKYDELTLKLGVSMGVLAPLHVGLGETTALKRADEALYDAKRSGRNRVHGYEEHVLPARQNPPMDEEEMSHAS